jgi:hypothetical protein
MAAGRGVRTQTSMQGTTRQEGGDRERQRLPIPCRGLSIVAAGAILRGIRHVASLK